ncbi:MAG: hypothetical protein KFF73_05045 [Cyclobacteriaceae bacterium]|nr:hypothetical protein [Cyclobacteriaceae bacterium]
MKKLFMLIWILVFAGFSTGTIAADGKEDKIINKYKEVIDNTSPDDWYTLARSADICLRKNINRREVSDWLDKSLSIKETPYNLEVKGDYYRMNNLPEKAGDYYLKAIQLGSETDPDFDIKTLQSKIAEVIDLNINN